MTLSCPNCNQTVLNTDTVCWHCGYQLPARPAPQLERQTAVPSPEPFSLSAILVYSAVTAVVIIALLISIQTLGQRPLILRNLDTTGWQPVTDQSLRFTLDIPPTWQSFAGQDPQQQADFETLIANNDHFATAISPLSTTISDMEILLIVIGEQPEQITAVPGFVVVARSEALSRLSLDELVALAQQPHTGIELQQSTHFRSFMGDNRASLSLRILAAGNTLICQQHLIQGVGEGYLLAGCAPETRVQLFSEPIEKILASFQLLR
jgi:hypothetical protein